MDVSSWPTLTKAKTRGYLYYILHVFIMERAEQKDRHVNMHVPLLSFPVEKRLAM